LLILLKTERSLIFARLTATPQPVVINSSALSKAIASLALQDNSGSLQVA
jgi:hypothetical protein